MEQPGHRLRRHLGHRPVPALQTVVSPPAGAVALLVVERASSRPERVSRSVQLGMQRESARVDRRCMSRRQRQFDELRDLCCRRREWSVRSTWRSSTSPTSGATTRSSTCSLGPSSAADVAGVLVSDSLSCVRRTIDRPSSDCVGDDAGTVDVMQIGASRRAPGSGRRREGRRGHGSQAAGAPRGVGAAVLVGWCRPISSSTALWGPESAGCGTQRSAGPRVEAAPRARLGEPRRDARWWLRARASAGRGRRAPLRAARRRGTGGGSRR